MNARDQANELVFDYKQRLSPYIKSMKERGYFGEAAKQQKAQEQAAAGESQQAKPQQLPKTQTPQGQVAQGQQPAQVNTETQKAQQDLMNPQQTTGGNGIDGDFLSIQSDVAPDPTDSDSGSATSRAPDIAAAKRPKPAELFE